MNQGFQQDPQMAPAILGALCVFLLIVLVILVFFLLSMQKALNAVSPRNRLMEPAMVWLMFVPCVNFVWQFFIAIRVPDSLKNEFRDRGQDDGSDYGKSLGLTYCIIGIVSNVFSNGLQLAGGETVKIIGNGFAFIAGIISLIVGIMFWIKIVGYTNQLANDDRNGGRRRALDDFDDDDGGYGRRKPKSEPSEGIQEGDGF